MRIEKFKFWKRKPVAEVYQRLTSNMEFLCNNSSHFQAVNSCCKALHFLRLGEYWIHLHIIKLKIGEVRNFCNRSGCFQLRHITFLSESINIVQKKSFVLPLFNSRNLWNSNCWFVFREPCLKSCLCLYCVQKFDLVVWWQFYFLYNIILVAAGYPFT